MKDFILQLLGDAQPHDFLALLFWGTVGAILSISIEAMRRKPTKLGSPVRFSLSFLLSDNARRIVLSFLTGVLTLVVVIRFMKEFTGMQPSEFSALVIGLLNDQLAGLLKKKVRNEEKGITGE